jgi:proline iminopeptidase
MSERYVTSGSASIWTDARGIARRGTLLLCSGGPGCCDYLAPVSEMLEDSYRVIRFEQRGCGRSTPDGQYDLQTCLRDMEAVREAYGLEKWVVGGHSWGGDLSLIYALAHPQRTAAALFMAGIGLQRNHEWREVFFENQKSRGEEVPPMEHPFNQEVNEQGNRSFREYVQRPTLYAELAALQCPVLLLCGGKDIRPQWPAAQLHELLPQSVFCLLPEAPHGLWLHEPAAVRTALRSFLGADDT